MPQLRPECRQLTDLAIDVAEVVARELADAGTGAVTLSGETKEVFDLAERDPESLRPANEAERRDGVFPIGAVTVASSRRAQEASRFVIAQRRAADVEAARDLADGSESIARRGLTFNPG